MRDIPKELDRIFKDMSRNELINLLEESGFRVEGKNDDNRKNNPPETLI
jgi:hypothetical protein